jgi:hypothetical protein
MLPHPDSLSLPLKEGIRDLRCSIRLEARSGAVSSRLFGTPKPTRRLARLADGVLTRAEKVAGMVLARGDAGLGPRLDRLAAALAAGRVGERTGDLYAVCQAILEADGEAGIVVSELRLAIQLDEDEAPASEDRFQAAARQAHRMARSGLVRGCLSAALLSRDAEAEAALDARIALVCWLAVLVRAEGADDAGLVLSGARLAVDAEGEEWVRLLRERRFDDLAQCWRRTVPYLP